MEISGHNCYHLSQIMFLHISLPAINKNQSQRLLKKLLVCSQFCFRGWGNEMSLYPIEQKYGKEELYSSKTGVSVPGVLDSSTHPASPVKLPVKYIQGTLTEKQGILKNISSTSL